MPKPDPETHLLTAELAARGVGHRVLRWTDPEVGAGADLVVVRTPWDYIHRCEEFLAACRRPAAPVLNPPDVLAWNSHKGYLVELAAAGVPVVPTRLVRAGEGADLAGPSRAPRWWSSPPCPAARGARNGSGPATPPRRRTWRTWWPTATRWSSPTWRRWPSRASGR